MISLGEVQRITSGEWLAQPLPPDTALHGGCFDTRTIAGEQIFFALRGEHADGHDHLPSLVGTTVRLAIVGREAAIAGFDGNLLRVADPLRALADLAADAVRRYAPTIVAVTGSYGKTTAKELIAHVLEGRLRILKTPGSLNNEIGVPITLLNLERSHDAAVLEFSARKPGDIDYLGRIAPPSIAVLLAVGQAHIGIFGSQEAIYRTKGEIFQHLLPGGLAVVNGDDAALARLAEPHRTIAFHGNVEAEHPGTGQPAAGSAANGQGDAPLPGALRAVEITHDGWGRQRFTGIAGESRVMFRSGIPGVHGVTPILAAWAVARELGLPDDMIAERAEMHPMLKGRTVARTTPAGARLLDDTYNASPETVVNLVRTLGTIDADERVLVLGHLSELEHGLAHSAAEIGAALQAPLDYCFVHAPHTPGFFEQLRDHAGAVEMRQFDSMARLASELRAMDRPGLLIGVKGARSAHMERLVEMLMGVEVTCPLHHCGLITGCGDCDQLTGAN